MVVLSNDIS